MEGPLLHVDVELALLSSGSRQYGDRERALPSLLYQGNLWLLLCVNVETAIPLFDGTQYRNTDSYTARQTPVHPHLTWK